MRPPWPRLALRSLVRDGPAGPGRGLGWPRHEWPGAAKLLFRSHLVSFSLIPIVCAGQGYEVPVFAGTTGTWRVNDAYSQCKGYCGGGAMGVCRPVAFAHQNEHATNRAHTSCGRKGVRSAGEIAVIASSLNRTKVALITITVVVVLLVIGGAALLLRSAEEPDAVISAQSAEEPDAVISAQYQAERA